MPPTPQQIAYERLLAARGEVAVARAIDMARMVGVAWGDIGRVLGLSERDVKKKYG